MQPPRPENLVMPAQDAIDRPLDYAGNRYLHALARHDFSSARLVEAMVTVDDDERERLLRQGIATVVLPTADEGDELLQTLLQGVRSAA